MEKTPEQRSLAPSGAPFAMTHARVNRDEWLRTAKTEHEDASTLLALWGEDNRDLGAAFALWAVFLAKDRVHLVELPVPSSNPAFPSLTTLFPCAGRMERAVYDLMGIRAEGGDARPWLRHSAWTENEFPLRRDFKPAPPAQPAPERYPFVTVEGDGVHEIPVGPVHAGIIEPGHFRFSIVGEKVLRLEERLGYVHKGIEKRFTEFRLSEGQRLAARVSGDSAAAYTWAYCLALESMSGTVIPARAQWLRALYLERERIANHLGDLGALGNDAGFAFGLTQFSRLKEQLLQLNAAAFGARYLMDAIVPGGVAADIGDAHRQQLLTQGDALRKEVQELRLIYDDHAGVHDRFANCGRVEPALARKLGLIGLAGRASGQPHDLRCDLPVPPYDRLAVQRVVHEQGDVAARVAVRFDEVFESLRLCRQLLTELPASAIHAPLPAVSEGAFGIGLVEGWRGPVFLALRAGAEQRIRRCHPHDPSWQNWPVIEHAVIDNIVPDFPLINKSFNLSYSGEDL